MIYLDYAANTPPDATVLDAFCRTERTFWGNPNANHGAGQAARREMERVTDVIAGLLGVSPAEIIYTSGASESNNLAVKGLAQANGQTGKHILSTPLEHASIRGPLSALEALGYEVGLIPICPDGRMDLTQLRGLLRRDTILVCACAVDSELGTVQPIRQLAAILAAYPHCRLHVDATQAVGKTALALDGVDTMSMAPHKFYGLNGSGILLKRRQVVLQPQMHGGAGATPDRSGTPALALATSAARALSLTLTHQEERIQAVGALNAALRIALLRYPRVQINSPESAVPHILNLSVRGVKGTAFQRALSEQGVCVSVKSACATDGTPSAAVLAVSGDRQRALSSWRISLSHLTTAEEVAQFLRIFDGCYQALVP